VEPEGNAEIDRYRSAQLDCGLAGHQPQRAVQPPPVRGRAAGRAGAGGGRAQAVRGGRGGGGEPISGKTYLPRKFKVVVAVPPSNDVDVFAHDLGYIAITDDAGQIPGWTVTAGGGVGS